MMAHQSDPSKGESITLHDADGKPRIMMWASPKGPIISLVGDANNLILQSINGAPAITIEQSEGGRRFNVTPFDDGVAICLYNAKGICTQSLVVRADDNGDYRLSIEPR